MKINWHGNGMTFNMVKWDSPHVVSVWILSSNEPDFRRKRSVKSFTLCATWRKVLSLKLLDFEWNRQYSRINCILLRMISLIRAYLNGNPSSRLTPPCKWIDYQRQYAPCNPYCTSFSVRWQSASKYLCSILNMAWCRASMLCHRCARNWSSLYEHFITNVSLQASLISLSFTRKYPTTEDWW